MSTVIRILTIFFCSRNKTLRLDLVVLPQDVKQYANSGFIKEVYRVRSESLNTNHLALVKDQFPLIFYLQCIGCEVYK